MVHRLKRIMIEPAKSEEEKKVFKQKTKEEEKIFSEGLEAVASIGELNYAVSTPKRFREWARSNKLKYEDSSFTIDRKSWNNKEPIEEGGKWWIPVEEFRQTGYGAWHIGSRIDDVKKEGRDVFIINTSRNRRFLFKEAKPSELEAKIEKKKEPLNLKYGQSPAQV
jgi:hypothetical protein